MKKEINEGFIFCLVCNAHFVIISLKSIITIIIIINKIKFNKNLNFIN